jgi:hypothetical protein
VRLGGDQARIFGSGWIVERVQGRGHATLAVRRSNNARAHPLSLQDPLPERLDSSALTQADLDMLDAARRSDRAVGPITCSKRTWRTGATERYSAPRPSRRGSPRADSATIPHNSTSVRAFLWPTRPQKSLESLRTIKGRKDDPALAHAKEVEALEQRGMVLKRSYGLM